MSEEGDRDRKDAADSFARMFRSFGEAMSELFDDPELKRSARQFADGAIGSAKTFARRFSDEDVRARFRDVGKAAEEFGKSVADQFREDPRE
ncbi:MAG: hypothetical protein ACNA7X_05545 [Dehalococcoidia bacterium]